MPFGGPQNEYAFLCIPLLLWAAFRFGPQDTATVVFLLSIAAIMGTSSSAGPHSQGIRNQAFLLVQAFVAVIGTSHLVVAIEVTERRRLDQTRARLGRINRVASALTALSEACIDRVVSTTNATYTCRSAG